jgi:hypothetical protein
MTPKEKARFIIQEQKRISGKTWEEIAESYNRKYSEGEEGNGKPLTVRSLNNKISRGTFTFQFAIEILVVIGVYKVKVDISDVK